MKRSVDRNLHRRNTESRGRPAVAQGRALASWWPVLPLVAVILAGAWVWISSERPAVVGDPRPSGDSPHEGPPAPLPHIPFTDVSQAAGIDFRHENGAAGGKLLPETMGGGCAFFDYDGDADPDLLLTNSANWPWDQPGGPQPTMALYENDGTGRFADVTAAAGLNLPIYGMGVAVGDYDNDGDGDLYVTAVGRNMLLRNDGGRFVDVTAAAGVAGTDGDWSTSCGWFDYDNDGDLDLFVCNYLQWSREIDLSKDFRLPDGERTYGRPQAFAGTFPMLFRNDGNGTFANVSADAGIQVRDPQSVLPLAKSLGVCFHDFDRDGYLDVFVANDTVRNFLFHNLRNGTFEEVGQVCGVAFGVNGEARGAMGVDVARFRTGDDAVGITIGNFADEMTALYVAPGASMQFTDEAVANGLGPQTRSVLTFGVFFIDVDLNGRLDFFAANGHLIDDISEVQSSQSYAQPPQLFWNAGRDRPMEFVPLKARSVGEDFVRPIVGRGAAYADIDADGDLDIVVATTGKRPRLLRNDQDLPHHWLRLKLNGTRCNRDAIGARVTLVAGDKIIERTVMPTCSYLSQVEPVLTFGLGGDSAFDRLEIVWPDGSKQQLTGLAVDRVHTVQQP